MRVEYGSVEKDGSPDLDVDWLADGWVALLRKWLADAESGGIAEPNAMVVGTVDGSGRPVTRSVLCKSVDDTGITFFTNYDSAKGEELAATPYASATFPWFRLGRQVHVRGPVTKVSAEETADYWRHRPRGSQLGAWASHQSHPIASRAALLDQLAECHRNGSPTSTRFRCRRTGVAICIAPEVVEFWQGRENRVHNRIRVTWRTASSGSSPSGGGSSPTSPRCGRRTSDGCGWPASSPSSEPTSPSSRYRCRSTRSPKTRRTSAFPASSRWCR